MNKLFLIFMFLLLVVSSGCCSGYYTFCNYCRGKIPVHKNSQLKVYHEWCYQITKDNTSRTIREYKDIIYGVQK